MKLKKQRPVLIVSNDANNKAANTITVVPLTSNVTKIFPFEVFLNAKESGLSKSSKIQCQQIRTISKLRIVSKCAGKANSKAMQKVDEALMIHLDLLG